MVNSPTVDAVVSVNGQVAAVDANGNFSTALTLQQGPNSIDVVVSDFQGSQKAKVITLVYAP